MYFSSYSQGTYCWKVEMLFQKKKTKVCLTLFRNNTFYDLCDEFEKEVGLRAHGHFRLRPNLLRRLRPNLLRFIARKALNSGNILMHRELSSRIALFTPFTLLEIVWFGVYRHLFGSFSFMEYERNGFERWIIFF